MCPHRPAPPAPPKAVTTTKYFAGGQGAAAFQDWSQALRSQAGAEAVLWAKEIVVGEEAEDGPAGDGLGTSCYAAARGPFGVVGVAVRCMFVFLLPFF